MTHQKGPLRFVDMLFSYFSIVSQNCRCATVNHSCHSISDCTGAKHVQMQESLFMYDVRKGFKESDSSKIQYFIPGSTDLKNIPFHNNAIYLKCFLCSIIPSTITACHVLLVYFPSPTSTCPVYLSCHIAKTCCRLHITVNLIVNRYK